MSEKKRRARSPEPLPSGSAEAGIPKSIACIAQEVSSQPVVSESLDHWRIRTYDCRQGSEHYIYIYVNIYT